MEYKKLKNDIFDLDLSIRTYYILTKNDIETIKDLIKYTKKDLLNLKGSNDKILKRLENSLKEYNLHLGMTDKDIEKYKLNQKEKGIE